MGKSYAGEEGQLFDHYGQQTTLVQALADKYGEWDERNRSDGVEYIWRFPETIIECSSYQANFSGTLFVRKGYSLSYKQPTASNASGDNNL